MPPSNGARDSPRPSTETQIYLLADPSKLTLAAQTALRELAARWLRLDNEIKQLDRQLSALTATAAPHLLHGVGSGIAGQLLITAGDNPSRLTSEAAFARLCGVAPQPTSSGRTTGRHRLHRDCERQAGEGEPPRVQ